MSGYALPQPPWMSGTARPGPRGPEGPPGRPGRDGANTIQNTDGTITVDTPTGTVTISINLTHANTWTGQQTFIAPILGTPASGTLTNCTGLPIATGVSGLGANVATFLATPSSANLKSALTDETGSGALVFADTPTLITPILGVATGTSFNGFTGLANPTGTLGLTAVNGTAPTAMRSDGAPALDQSIVPTWTGLHTFRTTSTAGSAQPLVKLRSGGGTGGNGPALDFVISDNTPVDVVAARIAASLTDGGAGTLDADMVFSHAVNGALINNTVKWGNTSGTITFPNTAADTVAMLAVANAFTAAQSITMPSTGPGLVLSITDSATTSGAGSTFTMRNEDGTNNVRSAFSMSFKDSGGNVPACVRISAQRTDTTTNAQTAHLDISTRLAGTLAERLSVGPGVQVGAPTGGDKGADTLNVKGLYYANGTAGVSAGPFTTITSITVTNGIVTALTGS